MKIKTINTGLIQFAGENRNGYPKKKWNKISHFSLLDFRRKPNEKSTGPREYPGPIAPGRWAENTICHFSFYYLCDETNKYEFCILPVSRLSKQDLGQISSTMNGTAIPNWPSNKLFI